MCAKALQAYFVLCLLHVRICVHECVVHVCFSFRCFFLCLCLGDDLRTSLMKYVYVVE